MPSLLSLTCAALTRNSELHARQLVVSLRQNDPFLHNEQTEMHTFYVSLPSVRLLKDVKEYCYSQTWQSFHASYPVLPALPIPQLSWNYRVFNISFSLQPSDPYHCVHDNNNDIKKYHTHDTVLISVSLNWPLTPFSQKRKGITAFLQNLLAFFTRRRYLPCRLLAHRSIWTVSRPANTATTEGCG